MKHALAERTAGRPTSHDRTHERAKPSPTDEHLSERRAAARLSLPGENMRWR